MNSSGIAIHLRNPYQQNRGQDNLARQVHWLWVDLLSLVLKTRKMAEEKSELLRRDCSDGEPGGVWETSVG